MEIEVFELSLKFLYSIIAFIVLLSSLRLDISGKLSIKDFYFSYRLMELFFVLLALIIGFRDLRIGADTLVYYAIWKDIETFDFEGEYVFSLLMFLLKKCGLSFNSFLFFIISLFLIYLYKSFKLLSVKFKINSFLLLFSLMSFFFFESITINVIRQGLALSFLLYSWTLYITDGRKKYYVLYLFLAILTHTTSIIPILLFIFISKFGMKIRIKSYLMIYLFGVFLAAINYGILNIAPFIQEFIRNSRRVSYLTGESDLYTVGFKPQFVFFNTLFLLVGCFLIKRCNVGLWYIVLFKYFILASFLFFMSFQIPYSDRIGLYSWIVIPILLSPFFSYSDNRIKLATMICVSLLGIYLFFNMYYQI